MAGHSKWANIKHRKGAQDAKRGKLFTKLIREITTSARCGGDVAANPRLRAAVDKALSHNMTRDTIDRAIKRGVGGLDGDTLEEVRYEGYGLNGVAVMVECLTDNRNRTVSEVRHIFNKMGGNLGTDGSVAYLFNKTGQITLDANVDENTLMEIAIEAGAEDVTKESDGSSVVHTNPDVLGQVVDKIQAAGLKPQLSQLTMEAVTTVSLSLEDAQQFMKMIDLLEDLDDVQEVYSNADISDDVGRQLGA